MVSYLLKMDAADQPPSNHAVNSDQPPCETQKRITEGDIFYGALVILLEYALVKNHPSYAGLAARYIKSDLIGRSTIILETMKMMGESDENIRLSYETMSELTSVG